MEAKKQSDSKVVIGGVAGLTGLIGFGMLFWSIVSRSSDMSQTEKDKKDRNMMIGGGLFIGGLIVAGIVDPKMMGDAFINKNK